MFDGRERDARRNWFEYGPEWQNPLAPINRIPSEFALVINWAISLFLIKNTAYDFN